MIFRHPGMISPSGAHIIADINPPKSPYGAWTIGFYQFDQETQDMTKPTQATFDKSSYKAFILKLVEDL